VDDQWDDWTEEGPSNIFIPLAFGLDKEQFLEGLSKGERLRATKVVSIMNLLDTVELPESAHALVKELMQILVDDVNRTRASAQKRKAVGTTGAKRKQIQEAARKINNYSFLKIDTGNLMVRTFKNRWNAQRGDAGDQIDACSKTVIKALRQMPEVQEYLANIHPRWYR
jgi:hypothetical protein